MALTHPIFSSIAGALCGIISGFGIGGGSLLMVWLTAAAEMNQKVAQGINLLYFIPTSIGALYSHIKNKMILWSIVIPAAILGCITAACGAYIANSISINLLHKLFGVFLCFVGIKEILSKPTQKTAG